MAIEIDTVSIVSVFMESILYGLFTALSVIALYVLLIRRRQQLSSNKAMVTVSVVMFLVATVHVGIALRRILDGFIANVNAPGGTLAYLSQVDTPGFVAKNTAYAIQTIVGDGFVLYRLYVVWSADKRVVVPISVCFVASIGVAIGCLQAFARASPEAPIFIIKLQHWIVSFFALTLFTNFSCTTLIAARIYWVHRNAPKRLSGRSMLPAAVVIIESGATYSLTLIILLSMYLSGTVSQYIVLDSVTQIIGIVFTLIIVRVGLGLTSDQTEFKTTKTTPTSLNLSASSKRRPNNAHVKEDYGMQSLALSIATEVETDASQSDIYYKPSEEGVLSV